MFYYKTSPAKHGENSKYSRIFLEGLCKATKTVSIVHNLISKMICNTAIQFRKTQRFVGGS
jgi:hypothetical protein